LGTTGSFVRSEVNELL